jgi:hypothetical protein
MDVRVGNSPAPVPRPALRRSPHGTRILERLVTIRAKHLSLLGLDDEDEPAVAVAEAAVEVGKEGVDRDAVLVKRVEEGPF